MLGVLDSDLEDDPRPDRMEVPTKSGGGKFGGCMSRLAIATARDCESDELIFIRMIENGGRQL